MRRPARQAPREPGWPSGRRPGVRCRFFSSRRRHTRCSRGWSSDVCSSDLLAWLYIAWFFSLPGQPFDYSDENLLRVLVWGLSMPFMAWMVGILKHRMVTLEQYRDVEETLRKSEEELRLFVRDTPASIAMFDKNMRYIAASKRWYEDYRLEHDSIIGLSHYEVFPDIPERWKKICDGGVKGAVEQCDRDLSSREDGENDWVRWEVRP